MADDILTDIEQAGSPPGALGRQTRSNIFRLPSAGWQLLLDELTATFAEIIERQYRRWRSGELHIRSWGIVTGNLSEPEQVALEADGLHTHLPAILSFVFYLRIPQRLAHDGLAGTRFISPLSALFESFDAAEALIGGDAGQLLIFPGYLQHEPAAKSWRGNEPRVVVSGDVYFTAGRTETLLSNVSTSRRQSGRGEAS